MEDERHYETFMKKILEIILLIGLGIYLIIFWLGVIIGLINNPNETLLGLAGMGSIGFLMFGAIYLHQYIINKNKIDWDNNSDLKTMSGWLGVASWMLLGATLRCTFFSPFIDESTGENVSAYELATVFFILSVFSFWTYFSLLLAKRNMLFLLRSYLLSIASLLTLASITIISKKTIDIELTTFWYDIDWNEIISQLFLLLIIALCIKGFILSFTPQIKEQFSCRPSYLMITAVVIILFSVVGASKMNITSKNIQTSNYPAINSTK